METNHSKPNRPHRSGPRITPRRVTVVALVFLAAAVAATVGFIYRGQRLERRTIARLRELNADFGMAATAPAWLVGVLRRCRLPVPTSIGSISDVGPDFCDNDLAMLQHCTRIGNLDLDRTQVSDAGLIYLRGFTKLTILELDETRVTDAGLVHLTGLPRLRVVTLAGTRITDAGLELLAQVENLSWVRVENTSVSDAGLAHLSRRPSLERVDLQGTRVTQAGIARLKEALPNVEVHGP